MTQTITKHYRQTGQHFIEKLGNKVVLEMVLIRGGSFMMGAPEDEEGSSKDEYPQHQVTVPPFFMGKYPVTQAQWKAVARLPKIKHQLKRDPSYFKGDNHPVEQVSWYDAVEFCARLSRYTNRPYRLPSEAEWEYACRAGTTTPFHFGETITTDLANYCGIDEKIGDTLYKGSYGKGTTGEYRKETTPVDYFKGANAFGLYDMHGNVWEWCVDHWHDNYENAPTDGTAWIESEANDSYYRLLRGGSWCSIPKYCRSASGVGYNPNVNDNHFGLRVVCGSVPSLRTMM